MLPLLSSHLVSSVLLLASRTKTAAAADCTNVINCGNFADHQTAYDGRAAYCGSDRWSWEACWHRQSITITKDPPSSGTQQECWDATADIIQQCRDHNIGVGRYRGAALYTMLFCTARTCGDRVTAQGNNTL